MRKIILAAIVLAIVVTGCSSKTVTFTPTGDKQITTVTDASKFTEAQAAAWTAYYKAASNPPVIAKITQADGTVIDISSQVPPPVPVIRQHENQYIKPIAGVLNKGIAIGVGGWAAKEIVDAMQGTDITNSGSGTVTVDRSETVVADTTTVKDSAINTDNSDNHVEKADPVIVTETEVEVVEPTVVTVEPEVVVVDPSYPPETSE